MAYDFNVEDAGGGWSTISTETRVLALDDFTRRGMGRYWRLIVPGSGLLRRQWLEGIKKRAESIAQPTVVDAQQRSISRIVEHQQTAVRIWTGYLCHREIGRQRSR